MENKIVHGKTLSYWKANAEEDYLKVPISVLKYITILEEELKQSSITAVVQAKPEVCDHEKWHLRSINAMSYRICDKCGAAL